MVSQPVPSAKEELVCRLNEFLSASEMSDVDRKLKELKVIVEVVIADQRKIADEVERSHYKALLKLFDQVLQVNNLQKFQTLFSVLQKSIIGSWFKIEIVNEDSTAVANQNTAAGAVNEGVKNMKAKLQSARDKLKNKLKDESSTADASGIPDPLADNAVDDLVEALRAELKSYEDSIMKCLDDRVKVLNLRKVAACIISNCKRRFEEWSSSGNSRSCKRKTVGGY